ncbi:SLATT domain-containing protein [Listeria booriae]|uniref:SLATT domain-containing protein n=1 Tax=Listeria booriae TaxID=1552123 RepID=UPI001624035C|nr:SLATT domain-containing protein [Listeria booriae]MBC1976343.1 SLATT domain-containing protein [Listeria booriae]MBC2033098.1 SLATT domain-containing protein [Listeria booriae]
MSKYDELLSEIEDFKERRVYITKKARMNAEERYLQYYDYTQIVLTVASVSMIALSVLTLIAPNQNFDTWNLIISIYLLGITLIITGFKLKERADEHKNSYIKITLVEVKIETLYSSLRDGEIDEESDAYQLFADIKNEYVDVLSNTVNHKNIDYLKASKKSFGDSIKVLIRESLRKLLFGMCVIFPVSIVIIKFVFFGEQL